MVSRETRKLCRGPLTAQTRAKARAALAAARFLDQGSGVGVRAPRSADQAPGAGRRGLVDQVTRPPGRRPPAAAPGLHVHANTWRGLATRHANMQTRATRRAPGAAAWSTRCEIPGARTTGQLAAARGLARPAAGLGG